MDPCPNCNSVDTHLVDVIDASDTGKMQILSKNRFWCRQCECMQPKEE